MQINGAQLASVFSPKLLELQDNTRKPVTIDLKATLEVYDQSTTPYLIKIMPLNQASIMVNDQQQAQFVHFFAVSDLPLTNKDTTKVSVANLSNGVQQYLQVGDHSL